MGMAHNRKRPRARTWTLEDLDREAIYSLFFDDEAFRWVVVDEQGEPVVTRIHINRRSSWNGDRPGAARTPPAAGGAEAAKPRASVADGSTAPGRHRATD